ncbi:Uncharacterized conserved protein [Moraxella cuniculi DSM 21768]|uniref:Uncharacterized conserved protein n=3 Tax=Moraxella cuniculi TaxID=34061 RepID=A0A1N7EJ30_9GAMM|nr:LemA family protein [Moraxella cuniculi]OOS07243.1 hypothetical protein B0189_03535 [Moraxella cuniculi]SIR88057.1 Uncharacterized conserved protein [Moraxella cuniculi DSM 21768]VEG13673.1 LemA family [Moraxella cuniculi]
MSLVISLLIIVIGLAVWLMSIYNNLQARMQDIRQQLSNLQAALKKRRDLIQQVYSIAKEYQDHEKTVQISISQNSSSLQDIRALSQSHPELRANQTYLHLMQQLEAVEQQILDRRIKYNETVNIYNRERNRFPAVLIAQKLSFGIAPYYEDNEDEFLHKAQVFERDDSEVLQQIMAKQTQSIGDAFNKIQDKAKQGLETGQELVNKNVEVLQRRQEYEKNPNVQSGNKDSTNQD